MEIIDFHSHVLPGIDDGSKDVETSLRMLQEAGTQGVDTMVATPHFYAWRDRIDHFLEKRTKAYEQLKAAISEVSDDPAVMIPKLRIGAEVAFFEGISRADQVDDLTINGTDLLLVEMPFHQWSRSIVDEIGFLIEHRKKTVILAHLDRYLPMWDNKKYISMMLEMPLFVQLNAESLLEWKGRGKLLKMIRAGEAHLLGSDCHGIHHRVPNLGAGREVIENKIGGRYLERIDELGTGLLAAGS